MTQTNSEYFQHDPNYAFPIDPLSPDGGKPLQRRNQDRILRTPNAVRFAQQGLRAVMAYAPSAVCSPSRVAIMVGDHTGRIKLRGNSESAELDQESTLAHTLKNAGYRTGCFGKWGLGELQGGPWNHGFDEFLGQLEHKEAHIAFPAFLTHFKRAQHGTPTNLTAVRALRVPINANIGKVFNEKNCPRNPNATCAYINDIVRDAAFAFMLKSSNKPFFVLWAPTYPHAGKYNERDRYALTGSPVRRFVRPFSPQMPRVYRGHAAQVEAHFDGDVHALLNLLTNHPSLNDLSLIHI